MDFSTPLMHYTEKYSENISKAWGNSMNPMKSKYFGKFLNNNFD